MPERVNIQIFGHSAELTDCLKAPTYAKNDGFFIRFVILLVIYWTVDTSVEKKDNQQQQL